MAHEKDVDYWREAHGGFRGSRLLQAGAGLLGAGGLLSLAAALAGRGAGDRLVEAGWVAYLLGLGVTGLGFGWPGLTGILPRVVLGAAALHVAQSAYLLVLLYGRSQPPVAPVALSVGRLAAVLVFVALAAGKLGRLATWALGASSALVLAKIMARLAAPAADGGAVLDATFILLLATAVAVTARRLRVLEDAWGREHDPGRRSDFSEFNNPEHDWNKPGPRS